MVDNSARVSLGRLVTVSLGAALLAALVSRLRRSRPDEEFVGRAGSMTAARIDRRKRLTVLPGGQGNPLGVQTDDSLGGPEDPPGSALEFEPALESNPDPAPAHAFDPGLELDVEPGLDAEPELRGEPESVVQSAVETTEIDFSTWSIPPAPPPVLATDGENDYARPMERPTGPPSGMVVGSAEAPDDGSRPLFPDDRMAQNNVTSAQDNSNLDNNNLGNRTISPTKISSPPAPPADENGGSGLFYGWILVAAVFIILCITSGVGFYNASVILSAATRELDASVGAVSGATGLFFAIGGLTGFVFAKRLESVDVRWFFVAGGLVGSAALLGLRWVTSIPALYVFFAVFGVSFGLAGLVPATTLITRWFDRRRSVALSVASTGLSMGGIVVTPFSDWLIDQRTLSGAAPYLAAMWAVGIIPMAVLFIRSYPSDQGLRPDGDPPPADTATDTAPTDTAATDTAATDTATGTSTPSEAVPGLAFARARATRFFIALCLAYAVIFFGQVGGIAQLFNMILERTDAPTARTALATMAGSSVVFRLLGGAAVLRLPTQSFSAALAVAQAGALSLLAVTNSSTGLILSAAFFGCSIGNLLMLQPLLLAEAFGVANYGRIYSFNQLFGTIGLAAGPLALGLIHDVSDYRAAFFAAAAASFVGCLAIVAAGPITRVQALWR
ncbi:MAG: MFS transporter [Actinomycetota bacterium]